MIKKYKNSIIFLPSIQITIDDILKIINIIKKHKLGFIKLYNEKDKKIDLMEINKEIIYDLIIEVSAKNKKDDFKICFKKKGSSIQYYSDIDSDNLTNLIEIEKIIKEKKVLSIPKKINSNMQVINSLFMMIFLSLYPTIKLININNLVLNIIIISFLFLFTTVSFLDFDGDTRIIINIKNKFKRFYYRYYSINNLIRAIITSLVFIFLIIIVYNYFSNKFTFK